MKIALLATGDIAIPTLETLASSPHQLLCLVTQPDKPTGRKQLLTPPNIKKRALELSIPILQPEKIGTEVTLKGLQTLQPDILLVIAYGQLLPEKLIALPRLACINLHASLLSRHRGASCIQAAIAQGDNMTGLTSMHLAKKLDAGDIIFTSETPISAQDTGETLHKTLAQLAPPLALKTLEALENNTAPRTPQNHSQSTYAPKLLRIDGKINWQQPADAIERTIRAYHPWPGTYGIIKHEDNEKTTKLKIFPPVTISEETLPPGQISYCKERRKLIIGTTKNSILISNVQKEGSKPTCSQDFWLGIREKIYFPID